MKSPTARVAVGDDRVATQAAVEPEEDELDDVEELELELDELEPLDEPEPLDESELLEASEPPDEPESPEPELELLDSDLLEPDRLSVR